MEVIIAANSVQYVDEEREPPLVTIRRSYKKLDAEQYTMQNKVCVNKQTRDEQCAGCYMKERAETLHMILAILLTSYIFQAVAIATIAPVLLIRNAKVLNIPLTRLVGYIRYCGFTKMTTLRLMYVSSCSAE